MKKKLILTITSVICIFALTVIIKNAFSYRLPNDAMGVRAVISRAGIDTLFIGSSAYRKGIDMSAFADKAFMLTYNGNEPLNILIELEEIISEGAMPRRVIIEFNPSMMDRGADLSDKRLLWDISMSGKIKLWRAIVADEGFDFFTFYDYWVLSNNDYMVTYPVSYKLVSSRYYLGGGVPSEDSPSLSEDDLRELSVAENPGLNELQLESLEKIMELLDENGIEYLFLESPRFVTMAENENYAAKKRDMCRFLDEMGADYILEEDLDFDTSNADFFSDLTHMSGEGKREYTQKISELL